MIRLAGRGARRVASYSKAEWNIVQMLEMLYQGAFRRLAIEGLDTHNAILRMIEMLSENST
jgi:hypothetical protein